MFGKIPPMKPIGPGLLFVERILIVAFTASISSSVFGLFRLSISSWYSHHRLYISRNLPVTSRAYNLHIIARVPYNLFYSCSVHYKVSSFFFLIFIYLSSLFCFLYCSKGLLILFTFPQNKLLILWILFLSYYSLFEFFLP